MNQTVTQMDEVTQRNAALVGEAAAAAESMQERAQNLTQAVAVFELAEDVEVAARRAAPAGAEKPAASVTGPAVRGTLVAETRVAAPAKPEAKPRAQKVPAATGEEAREAF
ncbi:MAG: hypothetical protein WAO95_05295 [Burkholderiales bacterium]